MDQMTMFEYLYPAFKIDKPIRLIELFSGVSSQAMALRDLGAEFEHYLTCEWEVNAVASCKAIHFGDDDTDYSAEYTEEELVDILFEMGISANGKNALTKEQINKHQNRSRWLRKTYNDIKATHNLVNIMAVKGSDLGIVDTDKYMYLLTYSFPCFTGNTLVLTNRGYTEIENVRSGDIVLSHDNQYHKVKKSWKSGTKKICRLVGMGIDEIECTENHQFYVRKMIRHYPRLQNGRGYTREFLPPEYKPFNELSKRDYLGVAINQKSIIPEWNGIDFMWTDGRKNRHKNKLSSLMDNEEFWWIVGRYLGDGWHRKQGGIIICCAKNELEEITPALDRLDFGYSVANERTVYKIHIALKELEFFLEPFGRGAGNKEIPGFVFDLPRNLCKSIVDGYLSADGSYVKGLHKITSISRKLIYGVAQLVAKGYERPYRIYHTKAKNKCEIEGRVCNQHDTYQLVWKDYTCKQDKAFYEYGYIWFPISKLEYTSKYENVYDIEVVDAHSFTANGVIVHNCQDLSLAGKRKGMSKGAGTRSGLLWEVERLLNEVEHLPQILLMENVPQVVSDENIADFHSWMSFLENKGYKNYGEILNAKDYGVAQNRERYFMVSVLGDYNYKFPQPIELTSTMKDYLEPKVAENYYINTPKAMSLIENLVNSGQLGDKEISNTVRGGAEAQ